MRDEQFSVTTGSVVVSTGFELFQPLQKPQYGYGRLEEVYTALEVERLVNAAGSSIPIVFSCF